MESQAKTGVPSRTRPTGTIHSCSLDRWKERAHHANSAPPQTPTRRRQQLAARATRNLAASPLEGVSLRWRAFASCTGWFAVAALVRLGEVDAMGPNRSRLEASAVYGGSGGDG
ncbi:hypothetical protein MUK42_07627 [Musa troglodytarum]|uniref:Uncharacterized protein n=1 Tax=Musa troglodytarum TaxID=320322 RepID=A0A9E7EH32_9LILI|nr:hypothetical protein MUK42_07627 [Musa troglodytarum]